MQNNLYLLFVVLIWCSCDQSPELIVEEKDPVRIQETKAYKTIDNIDPDLLSLDIYYTDVIDTKKPVVIWVHGGGWCIGDKGGKIDQKIELFQSEGYVLVSVNYRLSPFPYELENDTRIKYPIHNEDLADAIKWVYVHIEEYGGDQNQIALIGHSAGAHLVSLTGTDKHFLADVNVPFSTIRGVVTIDTEGYDVRRKIEENNEIYINAFGDDNVMNQMASPINQVESNESYPSFFVAKRGLADRIAVSDRFIEALENAGTTVSQIDGSVYDHAGINDAIGLENEELVTPAILTFLNECFK